jgi:hypothetical protein
MNGIFIHQQKYTFEILRRFGMEDCNSVCNSDSTAYKQMVGCLMYLLATKPDLAFFVCLVARYMERPT